MDSIQLLIRETLRNTGLTLSITKNPRQIINYKVFITFLIPDLTVKLLQKQYPSNESRLSMFLRNKVLKSRVVNINNHMRPN